MDRERRELLQQRFKLGELVRDAENAALFVRHGGLRWKLFKWFARKFEEDHQEVNDELKRLDGEPNDTDKS